MEKRNTQPESIKNIINKVVADLSDQKISFEMELAASWDQLVDKKVLKHTKLSRIESGTLFILVDHPSWLYEIKARYTKDILKKIHQKFGEEKVRRIVFQIGTF